MRHVAALLALLLPIPISTGALARQPAAEPRPLDLQAPLPFDPAVRRGTLSNGLDFYVRTNGEPQQRVFLRLAVKAGSLDEEEDQRGLAHFLEHMAFNGSEHFLPGELVRYFETFGARLGPHVNAYTSFEETVYMLALPTDRPEVVERGLVALADFAGRMTLDPAQVEQERGVVIEEWRGGLGAASRIRDRQVPVLYHQSRYAERLPIGRPEVLRTAPPTRLRDFYDRWYRPDRMAVVAVGDVDADEMVAKIRATFSSLAARSDSPLTRDTTVPPHTDTLVSVVADPEASRSSVSIVRKRPYAGTRTVAEYRRALIQRVLERALNDRFEELARRPDARVLAAGAGGGRLAPEVESFSLTAGVEDGRLEDGITTLVVEANRAQRHGFGAAELDRARRQLRAFYERAWRERDKNQSPSFAREYVSHFLTGEPSPGIEFEYELTRQLLPTITADDVSALARELLHDGSQVVLAISPEKQGIAIPSSDDLRAALIAAETLGVTPWAETTTTRELMDRVPGPARIESRREMEDIGVTIVRFANGVEAWLKPTDFKNDEIIFTLYAQGGASLAPAETYLEASLSATHTLISGAAGMRALDLQRLLAGRLLSAAPFVTLSTHGVSGSSTPADLETALQLLHQRIVSPGDDPDAFALLKRQLDAAVVNRQQDPNRVFGERLSQVNTSNHYTARPITPERVGALDRDAMRAFYTARFANAADFTLFVVGAFEVEGLLPLLARYVGTLPSEDAPRSAFRDVGIRFPSEAERAEVSAGQEPRGQAVMSFAAEPSIEPAEQEAVAAASTVLETALRDILREELGQTYGVSVRFQQYWPQRGGGHVSVQFGADPDNIPSMTERVLEEVRRLQQEGPTPELTHRAKESARRAHETAVRQNGYWLSRLQSAHLLGRDPADIVRRPQYIDAVTAEAVQQIFRKYFPIDRHTIVTLVPASTARAESPARRSGSLEIGSWELEVTSSNRTASRTASAALRDLRR